MRIDGLKAANHNGYRQIIRPSQEKAAGLKILVSAVQSRPSPPFISASTATYTPVTFSTSPVVRSDLAGTWPITPAWAPH